MIQSGIPTAPRVPWPLAWQNLRRRRGAVPVALLLVAPLGLLGAVASMLYAVQYGLPNFPIRVLPGSAMLLLVPYVVLTRRSLRRRRTVSSIRPGRFNGRAGVVFWYSAPLTAAHLGLVFGGAAYYGTLLAVAWPVDSAGRWTVDGVDQWTLGSLVVVGVAALTAVCAVLAAVGIATGQLARGFVALTPHGVHHRSWRRRTQLPWDSVLKVNGTGDEMFNAAIQVRPFAGRGTQLSIPAVALAPDPALLYHALRFYHANPTARAELADGRGLVRLRQTPVRAW